MKLSAMSVFTNRTADSSVYSSGRQRLSRGILIDFLMASCGIWLNFMPKTVGPNNM